MKTIQDRRIVALNAEDISKRTGKNINECKQLIEHFLSLKMIIIDEEDYLQHKLAEMAQEDDLK